MNCAHRSSRLIWRITSGFRYFSAVDMARSLWPFSPTQPRPIQYNAQTIEHVSTQDADLVVRNGKFPAKNASQEEHFRINDFRGAGATVETYEEIVLLQFASVGRDGPRRSAGSRCHLHRVDLHGHVRDRSRTIASADGHHRQWSRRSELFGIISRHPRSPR